jgi:hypothetical protein
VYVKSLDAAVCNLQQLTRTMVPREVLISRVLAMENPEKACAVMDTLE